MVKILYSSNIDAINWKIFTDYKKNIVYLPINTTPSDAANRLCQFNLFSNNDDSVYVINIEKWKLNDEATKQCIQDLHSIKTQVVFIIESSNVKNKIFTELKITAEKVNSITKKAKISLVHDLLVKKQIHLDPNCESLLIELLPDNIFTINNEINKLSLLEKKTFSIEDIKTVVFNLGDATVFNIVDSWLNNNQEQTIRRLNELIAQNITIQAFLPVFILKLVQIKMFLLAKQSGWTSEQITEKQSIPFWQQRMYMTLFPFDVNLKKINAMLEKLYQYDINVKKQKNIPYTQLIKILFS